MGETVDVATVLSTKVSGNRDKIRLIPGNGNLEELASLSEDVGPTLYQPIFPPDQTLAVLAKLAYKKDLQDTLFSTDQTKAESSLLKYKEEVYQSFTGSNKGLSQSELDVYKTRLRDSLERVIGEWKLLATAQPGGNAKDFKDGYFGAAFWNGSERQLVISHRGTNSSLAVLADLEGIVRTQNTPQINSACTFVDHVLKRLPKNRRRVQVSITGHSLGAWLAQVTAFSSEYLTLDQLQGQFRAKTEDDVDYHVHVVGFDSPGCRRMLTKLSEHYHHRYQSHDHSFWTNLNITLFFTRPNMVNTFGKHVGLLNQLDITKFEGSSAKEYINHYHSMNNIVMAMANGNPLNVVYDWPLVMFPEKFGKNKAKNSALSYYSRFFLKLPSLLYDYIGSSKREVNEFWRHANDSNNHSPQLESTQDGINLHYRVVEHQETSSCHSNVFSEVEKVFLMCCQNIQTSNLNVNNVIDEAFIDRYLKIDSSQYIEFKETLNKFILNCKPNFTQSKHEMIECGEGFKEELINFTKQLFRFLENSKAFVQEFIKKSKADTIILKSFSQNYMQHTISLEFQENSELRAFLLEPREKVLLIESDFNSKLLIQKVHTICCAHFETTNLDYIRVVDAGQLLLLNSCLNLLETFKTAGDHVLMLDYQLKLDEKEIQVSSKLLQNAMLKTIVVANEFNCQLIKSKLTSGIKFLKQTKLSFSDLALSQNGENTLIREVKNKSISVHGRRVKIRGLINDVGIRVLSLKTLEIVLYDEIELNQCLPIENLREDWEPILNLTLENNYNNFDTIERYLKIGERFVILSADPGMGKSFILLQLREAMCKRGWVIYKDLLQLQFSSGDISVKDFLSDAIDTVPWDFLESMLKNSACVRPIYLLVDSFDKLDNAVQKRVTNLLEFFKDYSWVNIWVTTNRNHENYLTNCFEVSPTTIAKLSEKQQKEYLEKFWKNKNLLRRNDVGNVNVKNYVKQVFDRAINKGFHEKLVHLLRIPLHVQMFANVLWPTIYECIGRDSKQVDLNLKNTCEHLFSKFIDARYNQCFERNLNANSKFVETVKSWVFDKCTTKHSYLAFSQLFPQQWVEKTNAIGLLPTLNNHNYNEEFSAISAIGFIYKMNERYNFFSYLVAEYFISDLICNWTRKYNNNNKITKRDFIKELKINHILVNGSASLRYFINQQLSINQNKDNSRSINIAN